MKLFKSPFALLVASPFVAILYREVADFLKLFLFNERSDPVISEIRGLSIEMFFIAAILLYAINRQNFELKI